MLKIIEEIFERKQYGKQGKKQNYRLNKDNELGVDVSKIGGPSYKMPHMKIYQIE